MDKTCAVHHKMLEKSTFFQIATLILAIGLAAAGFSIASFASTDNLEAVQRQVDDQKTEMRELRREMNQRFDNIDKKLDALAGLRK